MTYIMTGIQVDIIILVGMIYLMIYQNFGSICKTWRITQASTVSDIENYWYMYFVDYLREQSQSYLMNLKKFLSYITFIAHPMKTLIHFLNIYHQELP